MRKWTPEEDTFLCDNYSKHEVHELAAMLGRSYQSVRGHSAYLGLKRPRAFATEAIDQEFFAVVDNPLRAYILGLLAADGNVGRDGKVSLTLHVQDQHLVAWVRDQISPHHQLQTEHSGSAVRSKIQSKRMATDLAQYGVIPNKTYCATWPEALPAHLHRSFLLGLFDGDGTLYYAKRKRWAPSLRWALYGSHSIVMSAATTILYETGITVYGPRRVRLTQAGYVIEAACNKAKTIDVWLNQDGIGLQRKHL